MMMAEKENNGQYKRKEMQKRYSHLFQLQSLQSFAVHHSKDWVYQIFSQECPLYYFYILFSMYSQKCALSRISGRFWSIYQLQLLSRGSKHTYLPTSFLTFSGTFWYVFLLVDSFLTCSFDISLFCLTSSICCCDNNFRN